MKTIQTLLLSTALLATSLFTGCSGESVANDNQAKAALGKALFTSKELSQNKTMACATCHNLEKGMVDPRTDSMTLGASRGDDGISLGDRNAPTASYAAFSPEFHFDNEEGLYIGGQFLDGRAEDLKAQAKGPFLNPVEMNMSNGAAVASRAQAVPSLASQLKEVYGADIFQDDKRAYDAISDAIAVFETTREFSPFDSKLDRAYEGNYDFTALEAEGKNLFKGQGQCVACHPIEGYHPLLTDYSYDNLGVPVNVALRTQNGVTDVDNGLGARNNIMDAALYGAFKVSTLRNIAVTGPYMHNGLFKNLKTVVHFYNTRDVIGAINPETNATWRASEVPLSVNHSELGDLGLSDHQEDAIVAFMKTFTDQKFEALIP